MGGIDWMRAGPFGAMVHWTDKTMPRSGAPERDWALRVERFPAEGLAESLQEAGAEWLIFTVGHFGDFCAPNGEIERLYPGHCSRRDLVRELGEALHRRGMRLIVYFQTEVNHEAEDMRKAFRWDDDPADKSEFQRLWTGVLKAYALRWGDGIDGWWFDSCYDSNTMRFLSAPAGWDNRRFGDGSAWLAAARAGNPKAVVAMNPGVACLRHEAVLASGEDYLAGESNTLDVRPVSALQEGRQWHGLVWIDCPWGHFGAPGEIPPPRFSDDELFGYLEECHGRGGAVTFNIGIYEDGKPAEKSLLQLARMRARWAERFGTGAPVRRPTETDRLADGIRERLERPINRLFFNRPSCARADAYRSLARTETWREVWPDNGVPAAREVTGRIWNDAIRRALDETGGVYLPAQGEPYYLDAPVVLGSGQALLADPEAEIRLKPGVNTCMVRNRSAAGFRGDPAPEPCAPDENIVIEGGVWTTLATALGECNGNLRGRAGADDGVPGAHGVIFLCNARRFLVRGLTVRQSAPFAVHVCVAEEFLIENVRLEEQRRDGVHIQGGTRYGVIRGVTGVTGDDFLALNAWEWDNYAPCFGRIDHILAENIRPAGRGWDTVRMLPGQKRLPDGRVADCTISDVVFRGLRGVDWLFCVNQPNLELGRGEDSSANLGSLRGIHVENAEFTRMPAGYAAAGSCPVRLHADADGFFLRGIRLSPEIADRHALVEIGPLSLTFQPDPGNPETWVEVYSPDLDCTVNGLALEDVRVLRGGGWAPVEDPYTLVRAVRQTVNGDYPARTPRGGTGRGYWNRKAGSDKNDDGE